MYKAVVNSIRTELATDIDATQTTIPVLNASVLQDTKLAVIGNGEIAETIRYESIVDNQLIGCERGFQGASKPWGLGTKIARNFTAYDHDTTIDNINELNVTAQEMKQNIEEITPLSIGAETPLGAQAKADAAQTEAEQSALTLVNDLQTSIDTRLNTHFDDYVRQPAYAHTTGTASDYTVTLDPIPVNLDDGFGITIVPHIANADSPTLNINELGAVALKDHKGVAYTANKLEVGKPYTFRYVGTDFLATSVVGGGDGTFSTLDFSAYTTHANWKRQETSLPSSTWLTFLNVTGAGVLTFVRGYFGNASFFAPDMEVVVDGVSYRFLAESYVSIEYVSFGTVINSPIAFNESLEIKLFSSGATRPAVLNYTYMLKTKEPTNEQTILSAGLRKMIIKETGSITGFSTAANIIGKGYLLGVEIDGGLYSTGDFPFLSVRSIVSADSVEIMDNTSVYQTAYNGKRHSMFSGPVRFNTNLKVQVAIDYPNRGKGIIKIYYILD